MVGGEWGGGVKNKCFVRKEVLVVSSLSRGGRGKVEKEVVGNSSPLGCGKGQFWRR